MRPNVRTTSGGAGNEPPSSLFTCKFFGALQTFRGYWTLHIVCIYGLRRRELILNQYSRATVRKQIFPVPYRIFPPDVQACENKDYRPQRDVEVFASKNGIPSSPSLLYSGIGNFPFYFGVQSRRILKAVKLSLFLRISPSKTQILLKRNGTDD
jgi:hypothetical protein